VPVWSAFLRGQGGRRAFGGRVELVDDRAEPVDHGPFHLGRAGRRPWTRLRRLEVSYRSRTSSGGGAAGAAPWATVKVIETWCRSMSRSHPRGGPLCDDDGVTEVEPRVGEEPRSGMVERCGGQLNLKSWENVESGHEVEFGFGDPRRAFGQLLRTPLGRPVVPEVYIMTLRPSGAGDVVGCFRRKSS